MIRAEELIKRYDTDTHIENGLFIERHYLSAGEERPASGSMYYYVKPGERTEFHRIDCDEYWCFNAGSDLELWVIGTDGKLEIKHCGTGAGAEPTVRFASGEIFASRLDAAAPDGTFITCITVPRFRYDGFEMLSREKMLRMVPETAAFWEN